jgi:acetyl/propionyl-CoA carboxylase alpha subunit
MEGALNELEVTGIPTTIPLHQSIITEKQFNAGEFSTTYLDILGPRLEEKLARLEENAAALAAANRAISISPKNTRTCRSDWRRFALQTHRQGW